MKKLISILTALTLCVSLALTASGCLIELHISEGGGKQYEDEYTFNETHHWIQEIGGDDQKDYGEHYNSKGMCKCGYYFPCHNLKYRLTTIGDVTGYEVYDYDEDMSPNYLHVEVPKFYQGEEDEEPIPVISIARYALSNRDTSTYGKCEIKLESIKLNEGLLFIGDGAFCHSNIKEITIPDSVKCEFTYTFMQCPLLETIVIGDGITAINGYVFYGLPNLKTVVLGDSITEIRPRSFIDCKALKSIVLPATLNSIPEGSIKGNASGCEPQFNLFMNSGSPDIYLQITKEELEARTIPLFDRDPVTFDLLNPDGTVAFYVTTVYEDDGVTVKSYTQNGCTTEGIVAGWYGSSKLYYVGEWSYDENGEPTPNSVQ
ncbi:MAG: leucine-rich repeat domain-containing protein [Clostridia bacterium]|nr:leucine-rich repeat domain-containing protein [Clostridia bacterium]